MYPVVSFASLDKSIVKDAFSDKNVDLLPQLNNSLVGFGNVNNIEYYYVRSVNRIFLSDHVVKSKIIDIDISKKDIKIELNNPILGNGYIEVMFNDNYYDTLNADEVITILNKVLKGNDIDVICDKETNICHLISSNHHDESGDILNYKNIMQDGAKYKKCNFCFNKLLYLKDIGIERSLGDQIAGNVRHLSPYNTNNELQIRLSRVGETVLKKWPLKLLGYDYSFRVIENKDINAVAIPTGQVYVNSGLLKAIESDDELEAVLAHEIAHIELRHSLRQHYLSKERQANAAVWGTMAGAAAVAAGAAGAAGNSSAVIAASSAVVGSIAIAIAMDIYYNGYHKEFEREADDLALLYYFKNNKNNKSFKQVFKKLMYLNLCKSHDPDPKSKTHPQLNDRLTNILNTKYNMIFKSFVTNNRKDFQLQIDLLYEVDIDNERKIFAYVSEPFNNSPNSNSTILTRQLVFNTTSGSINSNISNIVEILSTDPWGVLVSFTIDDNKIPMTDILDVKYVINEKDPKDGHTIDNKTYKMSLGTLESLL
jgi:Zn-dependent protease with chaperone function